MIFLQVKIAVNILASDVLVCRVILAPIAEQADTLKSQEFLRLMDILHKKQVNANIVIMLVVLV